VAKKASKPKAGDVVRKHIPDATRRQVLMEAGYKCGRPVCHNIITLELHHMIYVTDGGSDDVGNLLPLCGYCHDMHHAGHFTTEAIRLWKGLLVALNYAFDRRSMDLLLYLTKQREDTFYSADGVLQFAGLIAAGLVRTGSGIGGGSLERPTSAQQVILTDKGKALVQAWLTGEEAKYRESLGIGATGSG
jgi:HNH endonuclease